MPREGRSTRSRPPPPEPAPSAAALLDDLSARTARRFAERRQILSYDEYLELVLEEPGRHLRDAAGYLLDAFEHYGVEEEAAPWGRIRRHRLFDLAGSGGRERLVGQEEVQEGFARILAGFVRDGRANRLVLLHGPNGSAKTTFVQCLIRALEEYSGTEAGALYRFHWVFPTEKLGRGGLGFGGARAAAGPDSFAHLDDGEVDARVSCEVRDHPILLLPTGYRDPLLARARTARPDRPLPELLTRHGLCHKCKQIFDALLAAYAGDLRRVLRHVQVERYTVSRGYRRGAVIIGPQLSVDAGERQVTMDRSLGALPTALQNMALFEPHGELVDGAGGLVVFDDLLKRPLDTFKYLLTTIENGEVTLSHSILRLNAVLVATSNEIHLEAFRRHPEFASFRGRLATLRVPYLREHPLERRIYEVHLAPQMEGHVGPYALEAAARWAVMTRLRRPSTDDLPDAAVPLVRRMRVEEKAELYAGQPASEGLETEQVKALTAAAARLKAEGAAADDYEGLVGASPREVRSILLLAAQRTPAPCLSPFAVLAEIEALCAHRADYAFLQAPAEEGGYRDPEAILRALHAWLLDRIEDDVRSAAGLVDDRQFPDMLDRYVREVRHWVNREKVPEKGRGERDPDEAFMARVEKQAGAAGDAAAFRNELFTRIGAFRTENPGKPLELPVLFAEMLRRIRRAVLEEHRPQVFRLAERLLALRDAPGEAPAGDDRAQAAAMGERLEKERGYCPHCTREAVGRLVRERARR